MYMKKWLILPLALLCSLSHAQLLENDLSLRYEISEPLPWIEGTTNQIRLIVRNPSPRFTIALIDLVPVPVVPGQHFFVQFEDETCGRSSFCENFGNACLETQLIRPNSEVTCPVNVQLIEVKQLSRQLRYRVRGFAVNTFDPDLSNNNVAFTVEGVKVPSIVTAVPMYPFGYGLMGLLMLGLGGWAVRRNG